MNWSKELPTEPGAYLNRAVYPGYTLTGAVYIVSGDDGVLRYEDADYGEEVINDPPVSEWCRLVPLPEREKLAKWMLSRADRNLDGTVWDAADALIEWMQSPEYLGS